MDLGRWSDLASGWGRHKAGGYGQIAGTKPAAIEGEFRYEKTTAVRMAIGGRSIH